MNAEGGAKNNMYRWTFYQQQRGSSLLYARLLTMPSCVLLNGSGRSTFVPFWGSQPHFRQARIAWATARHMWSSTGFPCHKTIAGEGGSGLLCDRLWQYEGSNMCAQQLGCRIKAAEQSQTTFSRPTAFAPARKRGVQPAAGNKFWNLSAKFEVVRSAPVACYV